ncbi:hypothetical protein BGW38_008212, partial [Lunasporangiospora selenospora]
MDGIHQAGDQGLGMINHSGLGVGNVYGAAFTMGFSNGNHYNAPTTGATTAPANGSSIGALPSSNGAHSVHGTSDYSFLFDHSQVSANAQDPNQIQAHHGQERKRAREWSAEETQGQYLDQVEEFQWTQTMAIRSLLLQQQQQQQQKQLLFHYQQQQQHQQQRQQSYLSPNSQSHQRPTYNQARSLPQRQQYSVQFEPQEPQSGLQVSVLLANDGHDSIESIQDNLQGGSGSVSISQPHRGPLFYNDGPTVTGSLNVGQLTQRLKSQQQEQQPTVTMGMGGAFPSTGLVPPSQQQPRLSSSSTMPTLLSRQDSLGLASRSESFSASGEVGGYVMSSGLGTILPAGIGSTQTTTPGTLTATTGLVQTQEQSNIVVRQDAVTSYQQQQEQQQIQMHIQLQQQPQYQQQQQLVQQQGTQPSSSQELKQPPLQQRLQPPPQHVLQPAY